MKVKKVKAWRCSECGTICPVEDTPLPEVEEMYQCGECEEIYEDREDAAECCK